MLQDHPTIEDLESFLRDASRLGHAARNARILRHLLGECRTCHDRLTAMGWSSSRLERLVHIPGATGEPESGRGRHAAYNYDRAFSLAEQAIEGFLAAAPPAAVPPEVLLAELDRIRVERQLELVEEDERFA